MPGAEAVRLSVVLPTFNESSNVLPLIDRIGQALGAVEHEVVVIDDDSPDGTAALVEARAAADPRVRVVRRVGVRGLRSAIQEGIDRSRGAAVAWMDCDLSMPPELLPGMLDALAAGADVVVGSRYVPGGADARADVPVHRVFSWTLNAAVRAVLGGAVRDYTSGFVCAARPVLDAIRLHGDYGEYCIDLLHRARRAGYRIVELPYRNTPRVAGESKTGPTVAGLLRRGWPYVTVTLQLRRELGR